MFAEAAFPDEAKRPYVFFSYRRKRPFDDVANCQRFSKFPRWCFVPPLQGSRSRHSCFVCRFSLVCRERSRFSKSPHRLTSTPVSDAVHAPPGCSHHPALVDAEARPCRSPMWWHGPGDPRTYDPTKCSALTLSPWLSMKLRAAILSRHRTSMACTPKHRAPLKSWH